MNICERSEWPIPVMMIYRTELNFSGFVNVDHIGYGLYGTQKTDVYLAVKTMW